MAICLQMDVCIFGHRSVQGPTWKPRTNPSSPVKANQEMRAKRQEKEKEKKKADEGDQRIVCTIIKGFENFECSIGQGE